MNYVSLTKWEFNHLKKANQNAKYTHPPQIEQYTKFHVIDYTCTNISTKLLLFIHKANLNFH